MTVRLYEGCWGVTRDGKILGPIGKSVSGIFLCGGYKWDDEGFGYGFDSFDFDIIRVFPSESAALAWVNRKPWWRRNLWPWLIVAVWVAFLVLAVWAFTGCSDRGPTSPGSGCAGAQVWSPKDSAWVWDGCKDKPTGATDVR